MSPAETITATHMHEPEPPTISPNWRMPLSMVTALLMGVGTIVFTGGQVNNTINNATASTAANFASLKLAVDAIGVQLASQQSGIATLQERTNELDRGGSRALAAGLDRMFTADSEMRARISAIEARVLAIREEFLIKRNP